MQTNSIRQKDGLQVATLLVRLRVRDLGFTSMPTTTELFKRAQEVGLELCPPEVGPYKRLADRDQSPENWYYVGMEPIAASDGRPRVFACGRIGDGLWLYDRWAAPGDRWTLGDGFLFRRRPSTSLRTGKSDVKVS